MKNSILLILCFFIVSCNFFDRSGKVIEREYYSDGGLKSETELKDGKRNGMVRNYSERGRLLSTTEYVNDLREGWLINYSSETGAPELKGFFKNDTQSGPVIQYYREGMLFRESNYVKGRIDGVVKTFWANGKLKAENFYKMGKLSVGLKEYDKEGNLIIKRPEIIFHELNQLALFDRLVLKISVSDEAEDVEFYSDELAEGKYLPTHAFALQVIDGVATLEYPIMRGAAYKKRLSIIAKFRTKNGNTMLTHRYYDLIIMNK